MPLSCIRLSSFLLVLLFSCFPSVGQQPKVLAPHRPVAPKLDPRQPWINPPTHQSAVGGLWMTDANMKASLYLQNGLKTDPIIVTPSLYLSNGVRYTLDPVKLQPSGTAAIDINQSLAQQGLAPYAELYGFASIEYQHPWAPVSATIRNVDTLNSVIFVYPLSQPPEAFAKTPTSADNQTVFRQEGLWWKQEPNVSGFLALANVTGEVINANVRVTDSNDAPLATYQVAVSPHGMKMVMLDQLKTSASSTGGVYLVHDGDEHGLLISGGLEDKAVGFSARLSLQPPPQAGSTPNTTNISTAELGLMTGAADPMMNFPSGTVFVPYSIVRNVSDQAITVTPTVWWTVGGVPKSARLSQLSVPPHRTVNLNAPALAEAAGLKNFNGSFNLVLDVNSEALVMTSGSVDQKNTYVFEVIPRGIGESASKAICYWSTGNGDDTMVTLWNPADEAQDFVFTLFYSGGHYAYPVQLAPRASLALNVSEILHTSIPDSDGNVIPAGVFEGSAEISGSQGEQQHILVSMDAAIFNVRKAICGVTCVNCNGVIGGSIVIVPVVITTTMTQQETFYEQWNTGSQSDNTNYSNWGTSSSSIATANNTTNKGLVTGVGPGAFNVNAQDMYLAAEYIPNYCTPAPVCPINQRISASGGGTTVTVSISQRTSGQVSSDDAALSAYVSAEGTSNLGAFIGTGSLKGCFIGNEDVGAVTPNNYTGNITLHRFIVQDALFTNSTSTGGVTNEDDTALSALRDDNPQSGGSGGKVYDLDAPGPTPPNVDGKTYRYRANYYAYATLAGSTTPISAKYYFYVRASCTKTSSGYQFVNDISGDNQAGAGTTKLTWNLQ